jgi:hypothetical protein
MGSGFGVDANRYRELARREAELAEAELERSRGAWVYALSQESGGLRDHFIRVAAQARAEWSQHQRMAKHFESRAARGRETTPT